MAEFSAGLQTSKRKGMCFGYFSGEIKHKQTIFGACWSSIFAKNRGWGGGGGCTYLGPSAYSREYGLLKNWTSLFDLYLYPTLIHLSQKS